MTDQLSDDVLPPVLMQFRDGERQVPAYLAAIMSGIDTYRYTFDQAVELGNRNLEASFLNAQQDRVLAAHFRERR